MKYLVIGVAGQLGRDLCPRLPGEVVAVGRERADLTRPDLLRETLATERPDVVVNCAAYNFVDRAESEPEIAFAVNALGVRCLAMACSEIDATLCHFSSDYVFGHDRKRVRPYAEGDVPGPIGVYGASKLAGEGFVRAQCPNHLIIRSCGLYGVWGSGGKGGNFVETMLRLGRERGVVRVVTDEVCTPTYTADLAAATVALLGTGHIGLFHLTNGGSCSRFEFAREIFRLADMKVDVQPILAREFGAAARRPTYAVLANELAERAGVPRLRSWQDALAAYMVERENPLAGSSLREGANPRAGGR